MKPAQIKELRSRVAGRVATTKAILEAMSVDSGFVALKPAAVVYPASAADVQTVVHYAAEQVTRKGKAFTVVARGTGCGCKGGALGDGVILSVSDLNHLIGLGKGSVTVQPGMPLETLQAVLQSHGRTLPAALGQRGTVGGLVATGGGGPATAKYGLISAAIKSLKVVLDDGSLVETKRLSRRELNHKKGLVSREGDIYRGIDGLLQDHRGLIRSVKPTIATTSGYNLAPIKGAVGSFDLSQLIAGAEGTLGIITEITLATEPYDPRTTVLAGCFTDLNAAAEAVQKLRQLGVSQVAFASRGALQALRSDHPNLLPDLIPETLPEAYVLAEFSNPSHLRQNRLARRAERTFAKFASTHAVTTSAKDQRRLRAPLQDGVVAFTTLRGDKGSKALPALDGAVPLEQWAEAVTALQKLLTKHKHDPVIWGDAGNGCLQAAPLIDLSKPKQRTELIKLIEEFAGLITSLGGTLAPSGGDGIASAPFLEKQHGRELTEVMREIKKVCDPKGVFNPWAITGTAKRDLEAILRHEYEVLCYD